MITHHDMRTPLEIHPFRSICLAIQKLDQKQKRLFNTSASSPMLLFQNVAMIVATDRLHNRRAKLYNIAPFERYCLSETK